MLAYTDWHAESKSSRSQARETYKDVAELPLREEVAVAEEVTPEQLAEPVAPWIVKGPK